MENRRFFYKYESPIGDLYLIANESGLEKIALDYEEFLNYSIGKDLLEDKEVCNNIIVQLNEYFSGERLKFTIPLDIKGTEFQKLVWNSLIKIPYGELKNYSEIALEINKPLAVRAVGQANRKNPIPIIIPCHRVIGKNGKMVGYAGTKIHIKEQLIKLESNNT